jgi:hypothetical protein
LGPPPVSESGLTPHVPDGLILAGTNTDGAGTIAPSRLLGGPIRVIMIKERMKRNLLCDNRQEIN